jgi:hypothetical protein
VASEPRILTPWHEPQTICGRCDDDGWVDVLDDNGNSIGARDCPDLDEPWHPPFNASGLLNDEEAGERG